MNSEMIDLRSDTVTRPTPGMMAAIQSAEVGDDVFNEDPTVQRLEATAAERFGMDAALFCPSGTMTNQIAVKMHTEPGDEVICHELSHLYNYEGGGIMFHSGASVRLIGGNRGRFTAEQVQAAINVDDVHFPRTRLVCVENTCNKGGGSIWSLDDLVAIRAVTRERDLRFHLDGARLFNALVATGASSSVFGELFDSISVCLSKGLGAPVGSLLLSSKAHIRRARRFRKVMGGGMRQAGYLAAAGLYALENHVERLADDHRRAQALGELMAQQGEVESVLPVDSNIVVVDLKSDVVATDYLEHLAQRGVRAVPFGPRTIRLVTHLDFTDADLARVESILAG